MLSKDNLVGDDEYIDDAILVDISVSGLGFKSIERISVGTSLSISLQFKRSQLELTGKVVRAFTNSVNDSEIIYGVELDEESKINRFLEQYISSFSTDRLKDCLIESALRERYTDASEGFEMFSLLLSLFKDITHFGDKEGFLETMLEEVVRILNAQRASIFLINPETNELEAACALGVDKNDLKFDYRLGIAGSVFTTGVSLNIDTKNDPSRFNENFDQKLGFVTKSIICNPIQNREDKTIGVIEVLNKRNQDRFTIEDEKTMKVLSLVFSSVFHNFNPISDKSQIRRFSTPFDRKHAMLGKTPHVNSLRSSIIKLKDIDATVLIQGERGVGKTLFGKILHYEGQRGLKPFEFVDCAEMNHEILTLSLYGSEDQTSKLEACQGGTIFFREVNKLSLDEQRKLKQVLKNRNLPGSKYTLDIRVMASTSEDLTQKADSGEFDSEFLELLSESFITIDPLRRRTADISSLVEYFLKMECKKQGLLLKSMSPRVITQLENYDWPGNIMELKRCVERAILYNPKSHVITELDLENSAIPLVDLNHKRRQFGELPFVSDFNIPLKDRLAIVEREMIIAEIKRNNGNKSKAAKEMGISREALRKKLINSDEVLAGLGDKGVRQIPRDETAMKKAS
jgi:Nif-specific regulatory protein